MSDEVQDFAGRFLVPGESTEMGKGTFRLGASQASLAVRQESLGSWSIEDCDVQPSDAPGRYRLTLGDDSIDFVPDSPVQFSGAVGLSASLVDRVKEATSRSDQPNSDQDAASAEDTSQLPDPVIAPGTRRRCPHCRETIASDARVCRYCGRESTPSTAVATLDQHLKPYYRNVFAKIEKNGGRFQATWNWAAFFFGSIWYLVKGMWAKALIYFVAWLVVGTLTAGLGILAGWILMGIIGNYDYYLKERRGTQLW